jgi:hypothetical protein
MAGLVHNLEVLLQLMVMVMRISSDLQQLAIFPPAQLSAALTHLLTILGRNQDKLVLLPQVVTLTLV